MKIESLANTVENNIVRTFRKFKEKPAIFLSKSDVTCYMYYLLVTDPFLGYSPTITNFSPNIPKSKTFLVHAGLEVPIDGGLRQVALSIGESIKETELAAWDFPVGLEIEHNFKESPDDEVRLAEAVKKLAIYKKGYFLCLNSEIPLTDKIIVNIENLITKHNSVRFFYVDLFSKPIKTNVKNIL